MKQTDVGISCIHKNEKGICLFEFVQVRKYMFFILIKCVFIY